MSAATSFGFGLLTSFDHASQEWGSYVSRLNQWFIANDITDAQDKGKVKRRAILLSALSEATYKLASDLALPKKVDEIEYDELLKLLDDHFTPKRIGFSEKWNYYSSTQRQDESHTQWAARLRGLAAHCGFKNLEEALLDRFIMGMVPGCERDKLFAQDQRELTLAKAVDMAESVRCARLTAKAAGSGPGGLGGGVTAAGQDGGVFAMSEKCSVCGFTNHKSVQCRFKAYKCKKCGKKGHLRRMCSQKIENVRYVEEQVEVEGDDGKSTPVFNIRCPEGKPMTERVQVNDTFLEFEIDSGSAVSVISKKTYDTYFNNVPLSATKRKLVNYTGGSIGISGIARVWVRYEGRRRRLELFVVAGGGPPLLGRDFIRAFRLELTLATNYFCSDSVDSLSTELFKKFPKLFSKNLGCFNKYKVQLHLKPDSKPIFFKPRPVAFALKEKIDREIDRLLELGVLEPVEHSEYASPIVPVLKKDGGVRLCADYSVTINKQLIIDKYPLPTVQELFAKLHGGHYFSKLDLSNAYNQCLLTEDAQNLTCINTHRGLFRYTRLVFGLASAPAIFQRIMECVLAGIEGVVCFLDDVCVSGKNELEHKNRLITVLSRLENAGLTLQDSKCDFFKNEIQYLGHIIDKDGIRKSPEKVKAIEEAPTPSNVAQLQSFLGLINYYRNFVPNASSILSPLYNLLQKKSKWVWTPAHQKAFDGIKKILASDQVLTHFDIEAKLILTVDASPTGLGAVLSQICEDGVERPISFASRTLTAAEKKYSQIQKEATAIIFGVRRFHQYLYGRSDPFVLKTDHKPLITIFGPNRGIPEVSANRLQRYAIFLSAYNYVIEFVRSADNNADYFSRSHVGATGDTAGEGEARDSGPEDSAAYVNFVVEGSLPVSAQRLRTETENDPVLSSVKRYVMKGWPRTVTDVALKPYFHCRFELSVENGCLLRGHKVVIPSSLRVELCSELHSSHFGIVKMKAAARERMWFPGIDAHLERVAAECGVCARLRPAPPHAPLAPWPFPPHAFHRIHLDFLGPFNDQMYLIIVDAFSKWVECYCMRTSYGTKAVIEKLVDFMSRFGVPHTLVSDNGTSFTSQDFSHFCAINGIRHIFSPAYHPASNGQAESFVKIVKRGLKSIVMSSKNNSLPREKICKFLFDYRNSKNGTTQKSPAELLFGRPLRSRLDLLNPSAVTPSTSDLSLTVKRHQSLQAKNYRGSARPVLRENDKVWIKKYVANKKYYWIEGVIKRKIGAVMYVVYLPELDLELTGHIDQIWLRKGNKTPQNLSPQPEWDASIYVPTTNDAPSGTAFVSVPIEEREAPSDAGSTAERATVGEDTSDSTDPIEEEILVPHVRSMRDRPRVDYRPFY